MLSLWRVVMFLLLPLLLLLLLNAQHKRDTLMLLKSEAKQEKVKRL